MARSVGGPNDLIWPDAIVDIAGAEYWGAEGGGFESLGGRGTEGVWMERPGEAEEEGWDPPDTDLTICSTRDDKGEDGMYVLEFCSR